MKRFEHVCTTCGRPFGRRYVAERHVEKVHGGAGSLTSVMEYMMGVSAGMYQWPGFPHAGNRTTNQSVPKISSTRDIQEEFHSLVQFTKDLQDFKKIQASTYGVAHTASTPPAEAFVAQTCPTCPAIVVTPITTLFVSLPGEVHQCKAKAPETKDELRRAKEMHEPVDKTHAGPLLKNVVETWLRGERYIYAIEVPQDLVGSISKNFMRTASRLSEFERAAGQNSAQPNQILLAIAQAKDNVWIPIIEGELAIFLDFAKATAYVHTITREDNTPITSYVVAIVPRYRIDEKKRKDEFIEMTKANGLHQYLPPGFQGQPNPPK